MFSERFTRCDGDGCVGGSVGGCACDSNESWIDTVVTVGGDGDARGFGGEAAKTFEAGDAELVANDKSLFTSSFCLVPLLSTSSKAL